MARNSSSTTSETPSKSFDFDLGEMDVAAAAAAGAELELRHPSTGIYLGIFIVLCGQDSKTFNAAQRRIMDLAQKDGRKNVDASVYERRAAELAAAVTLGWSYNRKKPGVDQDNPEIPREDKVERVEGVIPWRGEELHYSDENAVNVFYERRWIREQIEAFISVRENFFPG